MSQQVSMYPCPICREMMWVVGRTEKGEKLTSCGHTYRFKRTRSQKVIDRKYIRTPWGLEKA